MAIRWIQDGEPHVAEVYNRPLRDFVAEVVEDRVPSTRTISVSNGLTGGGILNQNLGIAGIDATKLTKGVARFATREEAIAGQRQNVAIDPQTLAETVAQHVSVMVQGGWSTRALGEEVWLDDSNPEVQVPPTDNPTFFYIKLTAGENGPDGYNGGVLINETVSGSAPLIEATAEINLPDSPFHGQTVRLLNTERRFVRAGEAGDIQDDAFQGHHHTVRASGGVVSFGSGGPIWRSDGGALRSSNPINDLVNGDPRTGNETRPRNIGRTIYMRIL